MQNVEDIGAMEFGGLGSIIPESQNLSKAWLAQQSAYTRVPNTYPAMSTGSVSVRSVPVPSSSQGAGMSMGPIGSPLPSLGSQRGAGMSMGPIGSPLPSLATGSFSQPDEPGRIMAMNDDVRQRREASGAQAQAALQALQPGIMWDSGHLNFEASGVSGIGATGDSNSTLKYLAIGAAILAGLYFLGRSRS